MVYYLFGFRRFFAKEPRHSETIFAKKKVYFYRRACRIFNIAVVVFSFIRRCAAGVRLNVAYLGFCGAGMELNIFGRRVD